MDLSSADAQQISEFVIMGGGGGGFFSENRISLTKSNGNNRVRFQANTNQSEIENSIFRVSVDVTHVGYMDLVEGFYVSTNNVEYKLDVIEIY